MNVRRPLALPTVPTLSPLHCCGFEVANNVFLQNISRMDSTNESEVCILIHPWQAWICLFRDRHRCLIQLVGPPIYSEWRFWRPQWFCIRSTGSTRWVYFLRRTPVPKWWERIQNYRHLITWKAEIKWTFINGDSSWCMRSGLLTELRRYILWYVTLIFYRI